MSQRPGKTTNKAASAKPTVSLGLLLVALAIYALAQWGGLDLLDSAPAANPAPTGIIASAPDDEDAPATDTPQATAAPTHTAQATDTATTAANAPPAATATPQPTARPAATSPPSVPRASDLPTIAYADLPPEAHDTIALIDAGGPFPYRQDDSTFQNRERILPSKSQGYYREYTVITPGADDRGARRIVAGEDGEMYYTDDHYDSFREIIR